MGDTDIIGLPESSVQGHTWSCPGLGRDPPKLGCGGGATLGFRAVLWRRTASTLKEAATAAATARSPHEQHTRLGSLWYLAVWPETAKDRDAALPECACAVCDGYHVVRRQVSAHIYSYAYIYIY